MSRIRLLLCLVVSVPALMFFAPAAPAAAAPALVPQQVNAQQAFIDRVARPAYTSSVTNKVPVSVIIAQAAHETGWGASTLATEYNNYFGIKCKSTPSPYQAGCVDKASMEYIDPTDPVLLVSAFRTYTSMANSVADHGHFLRTNSRYAPAFATTTPDDFIRAVAAAGYATDPAYADRVISIMVRYNLYQYDHGMVARINAGQPGQTVMGNLTVTEPTAAGFTTVYPCAEGRPNASTNNYVAAQTTPNFAAVQADQLGNICIFVATPAQVIWDQVVETDAVVAHNAVRAADTRRTGKLPSQGVLQVRTGKPGHTIMGTLTVTEPVDAGFTTAYPCTAGRPNTSTNNYVARQTTPNFAAVQADENGDICIYSNRSAHLIWDQVLETNAVAAHNAVRALDTRTTGKLPAVGTARIRTGKPGQTVMGNLTVTEPVKAGHTTAYPCTAGRPNTSTNNYLAGQTTPNFAAVQADENGDICFYTTESAHLIWDQVVETNAVAAHNAVRKIDTRTLR